MKKTYISYKKWNSFKGKYKIIQWKKQKNNSNRRGRECTYIDRWEHKDTEKMTTKIHKKEKDENKAKGTLQKQITPTENGKDDVK